MSSIPYLFSRMNKSGALPLVFGASTLAFLNASFFPPMANQPWAEQMVLILGGALLVACLPFLFLALFPANGFISRGLGLNASGQRQGRSFALGLLLATPPVWMMVLVGWVGMGASLRVVALCFLISVTLLPILRFEFWEKGRVIQISRWGGIASLLAGFLALWLGPATNWLGDKSLPDPSFHQATESEFETKSSAETPDVLLVSIDTLRADSVVGERSGNLPFFDKLRSEGSWAEWALSSSNRTVPGHAGMVTGLGALWHGLTNNNQRLALDKQTLAEAMKGGGYRTMGLINNPLLRIHSGFDQGFDNYDDHAVRKSSWTDVFYRDAKAKSMLGWLIPGHFFKRLVVRGLFARRNPLHLLDPSESLGGVATSRALMLLDHAYQEDRPFFFFLHYNDVHHPYSAPIGFSGKRGGDDEYDRYLEGAEFMDHCIQQVVERMERSERPFILCLTADHGEHFHEHGLTGHANSLYNELLRVPFILYGDGIPKGVKLEKVGLKDVASTIAARCGITMENAKGRDLVAQPKWDPSIQYLQFGRDIHFTSAFIGPYKWISPRDWELVHALEGKVFLWEDDPHEESPLPMDKLPVDDQERILQAIAEAPEVITTRFTPEEFARQLAILKELGYLDDAERLKQRAEAEKE